MLDNGLKTLNTYWAKRKCFDGVDRNKVIIKSTHML